MLYVLFGKIGNTLGKLVKAAALVLDIANLLRFLIGPTSVGIVAVVIACIKELPWWAIVLLFLAIFAIAISVTVFTIRKTSGDRQLANYPDLLKALDKRNRTLANKIAKRNVEDAKLQELADDLTELLKVNPRVFTPKRLRSTRSMNFLVKKAGQQFIGERVLAQVSDVIDLNDLGLRATQQRDFLFRYHAAQLEDMPIPPTVAIENAIQLCITYSTRVNNLLIFDKRYQPMSKSLSLDYRLVFKQYEDFAQSRIRQLIAAVKEAVQGYLRDTVKQTRKAL